MKELNEKNENERIENEREVLNDLWEKGFLSEEDYMEQLRNIGVTTSKVTPYDPGLAARCSHLPG